MGFEDPHRVKKYSTFVVWSAFGKKKNYETMDPKPMANVENIVIVMLGNKSLV